MSDGPSLLSLTAAGLYAFVAAGCILAATYSQRSQQARWHSSAWIALTLLFVLLLAMRVTGIEETIRDSARAVLRAEGAYQGRRDVQSIIAAIVALVGGCSAVWLAYRVSRGSQRRLDLVVKWAIGAGMAMVALLVARFISLHAIDRLLYGPLKLNWFADIGASLAVLGLAGYSVWLIRSAPKTRRR